MTEFVRGYVLPDFSRPKPEDLLSLLLVWDEVEVEAWDDEVALLENESDIYGELKHAGLIREYQPFIKMDTVVDPTLSDHPDDAELLRRAEEDGAMFADGLLTSVSRAQRQAAERGSAPLAVTYLAEVASALPPLEPSAPIAEASMIQIATKGVRVNRGTALADVLRFREKNRHLMGSFRGAMTDLAASLDADTPMNAIEQVHATLVNRVEPALANLTTELGRRRIKFATEMSAGASAFSLASVDPATLATAGGLLVTRTLAYTFDRDRMVRESPFGLIYRARRQFGESLTQAPTVVKDPKALVRDLCTVQMFQFLRDLRSDMSNRGEGHL